MAAITGLRKTSGINADQIIRDVNDEIYEAERWNNRDAGLLVLLNKMQGGKKKVTNFKYECGEEAGRVRSGTFNGSVAKNATSITLNTPLGNQMEPGMVLWISKTQERILITSCNNTTCVATVVRNLNAGITGTDGGAEGQGIAITTGDQCIVAGLSKAEGTSAPEAISTNPEYSYNYTQIFELTTSVSGTLGAIGLYGENDTLEVRTKKMLEYLKVMINNAFFFGVRGSRTDATTGNPCRYTGGVMQHLLTNLLSVTTGQITIRTFDEMGEKIFENTDETYIFGGMRLASCLDNLPRAVQKVDDKTVSFGTDMREIVTNKGVFRFVLDRKNFQGQNAIYAPCLDLRHIKYAYLNGRDTTLYRGVQSDKDDKKENMVRAEVGLWMTGYGLDHTLKASTDSQRGVHGLIYTSSAFTY